MEPFICTAVAGKSLPPLLDSSLSCTLALVQGTPAFQLLMFAPLLPPACRHLADGLASLPNPIGSVVDKVRCGTALAYGHLSSHSTASLHIAASEAAHGHPQHYVSRLVISTGGPQPQSIAVPPEQVLVGVYRLKALGGSVDDILKEEETTILTALRVRDYN